MLKIEEDIAIDLTSMSDSSKDDLNRKELLWESREEVLLEKWMLDMFDSSKKQGICGKKYKKLYAVFGVPSILMPLIMSGFTAQLEKQPLISSLLMITTGSLIGISTFFNLGKRFTQHFEYEHRYYELALEIEKEMKKPKKHRIACDVYIEKIYMTYCGLNARAPNV